MILDGENAWEYYDGGGRPFLRALYRALSEASDIQTVTMQEAAAGPAAPLTSIFPGSWIHSDFYIWIGHRDDHRAWDQLSDARDMFDELSGRVPPEARDRALEELLIAEGSDWFWWYGDDHSSDHDADFDDLFRRHLRNAYTALGAPIPEELYATNISTGHGPDRLEPSGLVTIALDGTDTSFLEWVGAAVPALARPSGAMHEVAASSLISEVLVARSAEALCLRLKGSALASRLIAGTANLALVLGGDDVRVRPVERSWLAVGTTIEVAVPFDRLGVIDGDLEFAIQVRDRSDAVLETVPHGRCWTIAVSRSGILTADWQA